MQKLTIFLAFLLVTGLLYVLIHMLVTAATYTSDKRYYHIRYLVGYIVMLILFTNRWSYSYILIPVSKLISARQLKIVWDTLLPQRAYELEYYLLLLIMTNLLLILASGILFRILKFVFRESGPYIYDEFEGLDRLIHFPWACNDRFYEIDDETGHYQVTSRGFTMSIWAKRMKYVFVIMGLIEIVFLSVGCFTAKDFVSDHAVILTNGFYLLPAAGFLLFEQIQLYLEGTVKYEHTDFSTEDIGLGIAGVLGLLRDAYRNEYDGTGCLIADKELSSNSAYEGLTHNDLTNDQRYNCDRPEILQMMINQIKTAGSGQNMNTSYQNALICLLNGKSVHIRDFIDGEFLPYAVTFMNFFISQKKTFMVLCANEKRANKIISSLQKNFQGINKLYNIWEIGDLDMLEGDENIEIVVCSWTSFLRHNLIEKRPDFFDALYGVIVTDGVRFTAQSNPQKEMIFAEIAKLKKPPIYMLISEEDNDSLRTAFEYYMGTELFPFKNDPMPREHYIMIWKGEGNTKIQRYINVGDDQSPYLGVSIPLALTALKYDIPYVRIYCDGTESYHSNQDAMHMHKQQIAAYLGAELNLNQMILFNEFDPDKRENIEVMAVHDRDFNFFRAIQSWLKYGGKKATLIHIISPPYMLREYLAAHLDLKMLDSNMFDSIVTFESQQRQSICMTLLLRLCNAGIMEKDIQKLIEKYGWADSSTRSVLEYCLRTVLRKQEFYNIYECFRFDTDLVYDEDLGDYSSETRIRLIDENIRRRIQTHLSFAKLVTKNEKEEQIPILAGNLTNFFLPGQTISLRGYECTIKNVTRDRLFAEQIIPSDDKQYFHCSEFIIKNLKKNGPCVDRNFVDFNMYSASVTRNIYAYWETNCGLDFAKTNGMKLRKLNDFKINDSSKIISITHQDVQIFEIRILREIFGEKAAQAQNLLAFMLQEVFRTLFPYHYMNLFAVSCKPIPKDYWNKLLNDSDPSSLEEEIQSVLPFSDAAENDYITIQVVEFSVVEMGLAIGLHRNIDRVFSILHTYLKWYLHPEDNIRPEYLNLGLPELPDCFAAEEVLHFLEKMVPVYDENPERPVKPVMYMPQNACTFCGRPTLYPFVMDDGRIMCRNCRTQQVSQEEELREMYSSVIEHLQKAYQIKMPVGIHVKMRSADSIRRRCRISGGGRVLGFYEPNSKELWIEARGPRNAVRATMIHELTHAWQFENLDQRKLKRYPAELRLYLLEGHTTFTESDMMRKTGEDTYADHLDQMRLIQFDALEYNIGFRAVSKGVKEKLPEGSIWTPHKVTQWLLDNPAVMSEYCEEAKLEIEALRQELEQWKKEQIARQLKEALEEEAQAQEEEPNDEEQAQTEEEVQESDDPETSSSDSSDGPDMNEGGETDHA